MLMRTIGILAMLFAASQIGCTKPNAMSDLSASSITIRKMSLPDKIKILPFTRPKSFDRDAIPDGIEVAVQTVDAMGDPVKAWGSFRFELYRLREASNDPRGERLHDWEQPLATIRDQRGFWDRVTQTYRFQLEWGGAPLKPNDHYVLDVTYQPPDDADRVFAEPFVFEFEPDVDGIRSAADTTSRL